MKFEVIGQGTVFASEPNSPSAVAVGPRCVRAQNGDLVCSFMVQSVMGINDFQVMLARSRDGGATWEKARAVWPHLASHQSLFGSLSRSDSGELFLYGLNIPIDKPGESFWSDANQGMKQNSLFWALSTDNGQTWTEPADIPLPFPGSAEAPGPLCVTRDGSWVVCYAPYNTFDPKVKVDRNRIVALRSENQGESWTAQPMIQFSDPTSGGAEAWVIELKDGRLLGACWNTDLAGKTDHPNPYALSLDGGRTWQPSRSTGILGQSTALLALPDGRALMAYNQRKHGEHGVWIATSRPTPENFGLEANQVVWRAGISTQKGTSTGHDDWQDFAFGEPCLTLLDDGHLLLTLWSLQPNARGILFLKLKLIE